MNRLVLVLAAVAATVVVAPNAGAGQSDAAVVAPGGSDWNATATQFRGRVGAIFSYSCPAGGSARTIWGTGVYTDDSSVCTAAAHAGKITRARGGRVTIQMKPGLGAYVSTTRHGITSHSWHGWHGSFIVVSGLATAKGQPATGGSDWSATATGFRGSNGSRYSYTCPGGGTAHRVWGSGVYTDDSSVCTAAVHAGKITLPGGGTVTIEIRPGESSYTGTTQNGITTTSYGAWGGSYVLVG